MKSVERNMPVDELVQRFVAIALEQDEAMLDNQMSKFNQLYDEMEVIRGELKSRENDQRRALAKLYDHPNAQVRLKAAITTLALDPEGARRVLQRISDNNEYPQAADARGMLSALDEGSFTPT